MCALVTGVQTCALPILAVALSGAVSLHHFVDAGLDTDAEVVRDWLWSMGINPDNVATAMPADVLIRDILIPSIGNRVLVVHHADSETPFVDALVTHLRVSGGFIGISGRSEEHTSELQ